MSGHFRNSWGQGSEVRGTIIHLMVVKLAFNKQSFLNILSGPTASRNSIRKKRIRRRCSIIAYLK